MSQHDMILDNQSGAAFRSDANNALQALATNSSGSSEPATKYAYQWWADTTSGLLKQRNAANTAWLVRCTLAEVFVIARSSNTILAGGDHQKSFIGTSTFTQTLTAAATLADGWYCDYVNNGTGVITLDPNSSELINGVATWALLPGEGGRLVCNGTGFIFIQRGIHKASAMLLENVGFAVSVAANALTVAIKDAQGNDPAPGSPVRIGFRSATLTTGTPDLLEVTAAASIVVSSGSTLGTVSATPHRIYIVAVNDAGTFRLGLWNPWDATNQFLMALNENNVYSSTAEGGSGAADSPNVLYTGTAVTSKSVRIIGYFESTQTTAGTWAAAVSKIQIMGPGIPRTGAIVQRLITKSGAVATGTGVIPWDDSIPQSGEGDQYLAQAITPSSAINILDIESNVNISSSVVGQLLSALFQDSTANALAAWVGQSVSNAAQPVPVPGKYRMVAGTVSATTFKLRCAGASAGTTTFNGSAGARKLGGVHGSYLSVEEVFA